jgi:hypothetical protein
MRFPQATERIKEAPAHALRAVFAGIGQLLLVTDRIRRRPSAQDSDSAQRPAVAPPAEASPPASAPVGQEKRRSPDQTGNVRVLTEPGKEADVVPEPEPEPAAAAADLAAQPEAAAAAEPAAVVPAPEPGPVTAAPVPEAAVAAEAAVSEAVSGPPLPSYDDLSIASLRARMRGLDVTHLRALVAYERAHAGRADVIAMFERRVAKLESPES